MIRAAPPSDIRRFRRALFATILAIVVALTLALVFFAEEKLSSQNRAALEQDISTRQARLRAIRESRVAALAELCQLLVRKPRIHAALEDDALDLLYLSASDELGSLLHAAPSPARTPAPPLLHAKYYRFLDAEGRLLPPPSPTQAGVLPPELAPQLTLPTTPVLTQLGYVAADTGDLASVDEIIATPIFSTETQKPIAALVVGFSTFSYDDATDHIPVLLVNQNLHLPASADTLRPALSSRLNALIGRTDAQTLSIGGTPHLVFQNRLNPGSLYPAAIELSFFSLENLTQRQAALRWKILVAGLALLLLGLLASQAAVKWLSRPVEKIAADSEENREQRDRAEAALETTQTELRRAARFSSDASHQLKTPVAVLRIGLEELRHRADLSAYVHQEIDDLIHETYRLTSMIEDLLLLSRMDAGRLQLEFASVDLIPLINGWLDDLSVLPDVHSLTITTALPERLVVKGEKRFISQILQNLLENARRYNRTAGKIHLSARRENHLVKLIIANTGRAIPPASHEHIFERFHRAAAAEDTPGHGLGLNLARELARLHGGDVVLVRSKDDWTEFMVSFQHSDSTPPLPTI